jgi:hypothetical protein
LNKTELKELCVFFHQNSDFITSGTESVLITFEPWEETTFISSVKLLRTQSGDNEIEEIDNTIGIELHHFLKRSNIITISRQNENVIGNIRANSAYFTIGKEHFSKFVPLLDNHLTSIEEFYLCYTKYDGKNVLKVYSESNDEYFEASCFASCLKIDPFSMIYRPAISGSSAMT